MLVQTEDIHLTRNKSKIIFLKTNRLYKIHTYTGLHYGIDVKMASENFQTFVWRILVNIFEMTFLN